MKLLVPTVRWFRTDTVVIFKWFLELRISGTFLGGTIVSETELCSWDRREQREMI